MALDQTRDRRQSRLLSENEVTFDGIVGREVLVDCNDQKLLFFEEWAAAALEAASWVVSPAPAFFPSLPKLQVM